MLNGYMFRVEDRVVVLEDSDEEDDLCQGSLVLLITFATQYMVERGW